MRKIILPVAAAAFLVAGSAGVSSADTTPTSDDSGQCQAYTDAQAQLTALQNQLGDAQSQLGTLEQQVRDLNAAKNTAQSQADDLAEQIRAASADKIKNQQALPGLQAALDAATTERGQAAAALRDATNAAAGAADDIELRKGYISAFQSKYAAASAKAEHAKDVIGSSQAAYRKAKDAGDTAGMEAAHAAAEAARADLSKAQADMDHYGPASQAVQQGHIDKDQALLDAVDTAQAKLDEATETRGAAAAALRDAQRAIDADTALGKQLYPQYQAALAAVKDAQTKGGAIYKQVMSMRGQVSDLTGQVSAAQTALDGVVCPTDPNQGDAPGTPGAPGGTGGTGGAGGSGSEAATTGGTGGASGASSEAGSMVPASLHTSLTDSSPAPQASPRRSSVVIGDKALSSAAHTPRDAVQVTPASLAETGVSDVLPWIGVGGLLATAAGSSLWLRSRRYNH